MCAAFVPWAHTFPKATRVWRESNGCELAGCAWSVHTCSASVYLHLRAVSIEWTQAKHVAMECCGRRHSWPPLLSYILAYVQCANWNRTDYKCGWNVREKRQTAKVAEQTQMCQAKSLVTNIKKAQAYTCTRIAGGWCMCVCAGLSSSCHTFRFNICILVWVEQQMQTQIQI